MIWCNFGLHVIFLRPKQGIFTDKNDNEKRKWWWIACENHEFCHLLYRRIIHARSLGASGALTARDPIEIAIVNPPFQGKAIPNKPQSPVIFEFPAQSEVGRWGWGNLGKTSPEDPADQNSPRQVVRIWPKLLWRCFPPKKKPGSWKWVPKMIWVLNMAGCNGVIVFFWRYLPPCGW